MPLDESKAQELMSRAARLGAGSERSGKPGKDEQMVAWALCAQALRRQDEAGLNELLGKFNFFPSASSEGLLWLAASGQGAQGFQALTEKFLENELTDSDGRDEDLGLRLRRRAYIRPYDAGRSETRFRDAFNKTGAAGEGPVASALIADSPEALAILLSRPEWFDALLELEPKPMELKASMSRQEILKEGQRAEAAYESSLLAEAMRMNAGGCAGLLLAIPEFCQNIISGRCPSLRHLDYSQRGRQDAFEEEETVQFSFFETLLMKPSSIREEWCSKDTKAERLEWAIDQAIESVDPAWVEPQGGTGMLWTQMLVSRCYPYNEKQEARLMRRLERLEERGHDVDWDSVVHAASSYQSSTVKEWSELRRASEREEAMAPKKPALSL